MWGRGVAAETTAFLQPPVLGEAEGMPAGPGLASSQRGSEKAKLAEQLGWGLIWAPLWPPSISALREGTDPTSRVLGALPRVAPGFLRSWGTRFKAGWSGASVVLTPLPPRSRPDHIALKGESL